MGLEINTRRTAYQNFHRGLSGSNLFRFAFEECSSLSTSSSPLFTFPTVTEVIATAERKEESHFCLKIRIEFRIDLWESRDRYQSSLAMFALFAAILESERQLIDMVSWSIFFQD